MLSLRVAGWGVFYPPIVGFENDLLNGGVFTPRTHLVEWTGTLGYTGRRNISLFGMAKQVDLADKDEVGDRRGTIGHTVLAQSYSDGGRRRIGVTLKSRS